MPAPQSVASSNLPARSSFSMACPRASNSRYNLPYAAGRKHVSFSRRSNMSEITDAILINGLEFYAFHGASDEEQTVGHRYLVDVRLTVDTRPAGQSDRLHDTVSYARVAKRIVEVGTQTQYRLLEALAAHIVTVLFAEFALVEAIQLRVQKLAPPMNSIVSSVGVEILRN